MEEAGTEFVKNWHGREVVRRHYHHGPVVRDGVTLVRLFSYRHVWANNVMGMPLPKAMLQAMYDLIPPNLRDNHITILVKFSRGERFYITFSDGSCWIRDFFDDDPIRIDEPGSVHHFGWSV